MNDTEIESLLRKAPRPAAPAALQRQLLADIRLPQSANDIVRAIDLTPMWKRWFPALSFAVLFLGCLIGLAIQTSQIFELRRQNEALMAGATDLDQLRVDNAEVQRLRAATQAAGQSQRELEELAKLRAELEPLRARNAELNTLRAENQRLRAERAAATASGVAGEGDPFSVMKAKAQATACINNLKQIGLAARIWANDHKTDILPTDWLTMKNELNTPKILTCPADTGRVRTASWDQFDGSSVTYEFPSIEPSEREPNTVFTRCPVHGNVGLSDGSAHMGPNLSLQTVDGKATMVRPEFIGK